VYAAVEGKDSHRWWCWVFVGPDTTVFSDRPVAIASRRGRSIRSSPPAPPVFFLNFDQLSRLRRM